MMGHHATENGNIKIFAIQVINQTFKKILSYSIATISSSDLKQ